MPNIKHTILGWARETAKLSLEEAAQKLSLADGKDSSAVDKLVAIEEGTKQPSRSLLLRMSKLYHRPLITFYLNRRPAIGDRGEDFRTLPADYDEAENAYVDVLIRDIKACQSTIRETLIEEEEAKPLDFVGKCTMAHGVERVVQAIRDAISVDLAEYRGRPNHTEAFKYLRHKDELAGVFVLLKGNLGSYHSNIAVAVFRGFALADDVAPFIVINDMDNKAAWSFTLLHEMAHLILGQTGVSGAYAEKQIEKFCNDVASEFLLPADEFSAFQLANRDLGTAAAQISDYALSKKISNTLVAYRLFKRGSIDKALWEQLSARFRDLWLEQRARVKEQSAHKEGGPNYYVIQQFKLGALVDFAHRMTYSGALTTTKAGMLLGVKPLKVHRLFLTA